MVSQLSHRWFYLYVNALKSTQIYVICVSMADLVNIQIGVGFAVIRMYRNLLKNAPPTEGQTRSFQKRDNTQETINWRNRIYLYNRPLTLVQAKIISKKRNTRGIIQDVLFLYRGCNSAGSPI